MLDQLLADRKLALLSGEPVLREKSFDVFIETLKEKRPKTFLEVGVNMGYSGIAAMLTLPEIRVTGIEIDEDKKVAAEKNYARYGVSERAKIFLGDAGEIIPLLSGSYDFIFLDGPKGHYHEYLPYLVNLLPVGGVLFADNVLFRGYVGGKVKTPHRFMTAKHSLENFIKGITENGNLKTQIIDVEDGISITEKLK